jgi:hypothetical protein
MNYILFALKAMQLFTAVLHEVHEVQAALPGAPGAEKSQAVINKVAPIAEVLGAHQDAVQSIINGAVSLYKQARIGGFGEAGS